jgi:hypothetical protein
MIAPRPKWLKPREEVRRLVEGIDKAIAAAGFQYP